MMPSPTSSVERMLGRSSHRPVEKSIDRWGWERERPARRTQPSTEAAGAPGRYMRVHEVVHEHVGSVLAAKLTTLLIGRS